MIEKIDILNLEWPANERDVYAVAPIILNLRKKGYRCVTGDIFSYLYYFTRYRPKVLLITSFQGALINHQVCQEAYRLGISIVSLIAEGNTRESMIEEMTWGNNKSKEIYFEKMLLWSYRSEDLMLRYFPQLQGKTRVVGGVGFDRYKLLPFKSKDDFLNEQNFTKGYKSIVGLAGWGFDAVHDTEFFKKNSKAILGNMREGQLELHRKDFEKLTNFYFDLVTNHPENLFIVRPHPGLTDYFYDEFKNVISLSNVYYSKPRECKYSISDLISISDIWGGYETTTCLEAWLLGKQTFLFNPSGPDFNRDLTAEGSMIFECFDKLNEEMKDISLLVNKIKSDSHIVARRHRIIKDVIGFDDGKNYIRAIKEIEPVIAMSNVPKYSFIDVFGGYNMFLLMKRGLRNINWLSKIRGERCVDNMQTERMIDVFVNSPIYLDINK